MSIPGRKMKVNGINLNVYMEGNGPSLLLLHGFPDSNALWRNVIPRLVAGGYRVIAPDLRGFGESDAPRGRKNYAIERVASDMVAILDALGIESVSLVGHDWGAIVAWFTAWSYPERVDRLVAISVGHPKAYARAGLEQKRKAWYVLFFQLPGIAEKAIMAANWAFARRFMGRHPEFPRWLADLSRPGRLTAGLNWYRANLIKLWTAAFRNVSVPVMGIYSTRDVALAEDQMINSAAFVDAEWRYERIDGVSHWIPLDAPERLSALLLDFFEHTADA